MSKYKYLIIILMIIKSLFYSEARDFSNIFVLDENNEMYFERMGNQGLPYIGEKHNVYLDNFVKRNPGKGIEPLTEEEYSILLSSIPRINETMEAVNERNNAVEIVFHDTLNVDYKLQHYTKELFIQLKNRYPLVYETYTDYFKRMKDLELERFGIQLFTCLKMFCPNIGELYGEYISTRKDKYNITGIDKEEFERFKNLYPILKESYNNFSYRLENDLLVLFEQGLNNLKQYYKGSWSLFPIFSETYDEYTERMEKKMLIPMQRTSFIFYQACYPNLCVLYEEFKETMAVIGDNKRFQDLGLEKYSKDIFNKLKSKFPRPFESQEQFDRRMSMNNDFHQVYDRFFAKRMYPKMSETFSQFNERIENIFFPKQSEISDRDYSLYKNTLLKRISKSLFENYKKGYPQFNVKFKSIDYNIIDILSGNGLEMEELKLKVNEFDELLKKMPILFETYPHYKQRMFMLALNGLDEEEFNDLKRTYIEQCETYNNYVTRMKALEIQPMDPKYAAKLKIIVPREDELDPTSNEDNFYARYVTIEEEDIEDPIIILGDSSFFIENPEKAKPAIDIGGLKVRGDYEEEFTGKRSVVKFHRINRQIFILVHPSPYENYENYKKRIVEVKKNYAFEDSLEIESYGRHIFKTFIQPLAENEFKDLKLRFPKLSETMNIYETRLSEYGLTIVINTHFNLFKTFKRVQIQPFDDSESYKLRYENLKSNKGKLLAKMNISFHKEYDSFPSFLNTLDHNDYNDLMDVYPKYYHTLEEHKTIMDSLYLQPFETDIFIMIKEVFPHLLDNDYKEYESRVHNSSIYFKMKGDKNWLSIFNENFFKQLKSGIPKRFESLKAFEERTSTNIYTADEIESFKRIYPKVCSTLEEYTVTMNKMGILSLIKETFEFYNNQFPERDETEYDKYLIRLTNYFLLDLQVPVSIMSREEFDLLRSRFPRVPERYSNYVKHLDSSLCPLDKSEFDDLKKLFSIPYEKHAEHVRRLNSYSKKPLTLTEFRIEKSLRVLVGESFVDHVVRIIDIFIPDPYGVNGSLYYTPNTIQFLVKNKGMESLEVDNFIDHMLTYPFNYDSFGKFCLRQDEKKSKAETDPLVKTQEWYERMKTLLPKLSDKNIEAYRIRAKENELEFPDITLKQFYRHIYELPHPTEPFSIFNSRTQPKDSGNLNIKFPIPPSAISVPLPPLLDISPLTSPTPPTLLTLPPSMTSLNPLTISTPLSRRTKWSPIAMSPRKDTCEAISQRCIDDNKFELCPEIHKFFNLKKFKKEVYKTFLSLSPNFYIDHENYSSMKQEMHGDQLKEDEFLAFKECLPKLDDKIDKFKTKIESMGLKPIEEDDFIKLKIFYPRIHQITYENYILDIEIKYDRTTTNYRDIINKFKLSRDEFTEYKLSFPRQFEFSYSTYKKRMDKENIKKILNEEDYNVIRKFNYPQVNETYKQHGQKLFSYGVDPIPLEIFNFLKGIYPTLLKKRYEHRVKHYVTKFLRLPDYTKDKYKYNKHNEMIAEIIDKSNPDQEIQDKVNILLPQMMSNEELSLFIDRFPIVFQSYPNYLENWSKNYSNDLVNLPLDKTIFDSLKEAYFMSIDETYEEYKKRMKSLRLHAIPRNLFRYCKKFYPNLKKDYNDYTTSLQKYENFEIKKSKKNKSYKFLHLENKIISEEDYQTFQNNFPRAFEIFVGKENYQSNASIFNHDNLDSIKTCYFPRLIEDYNTYTTKMINLGLNVLDHKSFIFFKAIYPNPVTATDYNLYIENINSIDKNPGPSVDRRYIMTELEFNTCLTQDFPRLIFQSWEKFLKGISNLGMINDKGVFSKNLFNDLKMVFYPKLGQTMDTYRTYVVSMEIWCDVVIWKDYFINAILLYPTFFDEYNIYKFKTYTLPLDINKYQLDYLKLNEEEFEIFYQLFPLPYESYKRYEIRNKSKQLLYLTEEEFSYYLQVFPQISETYEKYENRLKNELYVKSIVSNDLFKLFKELFPLIDEIHDVYQTRFDKALRDSDDDTKKQLSFLVTHMEFIALDISEITEPGGMEYDDFQLFKNSLPMPEELREDYIIRINDLAKEKESLGLVPPEILPLSLFDNLVEIYPKHDVSDYTTYCDNMKEINVIPVPKDTFDKLVKVANKMIENRFDDKIPNFFNDIVNTA